jgi:hypothetical protein
MFPIINVPAIGRVTGRAYRCVHVPNSFPPKVKDKECAMKSLMTGGILIASLALTGNAAMAAASHIQKTTRAAPVTHRVTHPRVAGRAPGRSYAYAPAALPFNVGQFIQSMLGGPLPPPYAQIVQNAMKESASRRSGTAGDSGYDWSASPTYDTSTPPDTTGQDTAAAAMAEDQTIQEINDTNAQTASMAAAEEENDEANAATLQTEINAGM